MLYLRYNTRVQKKAISLHPLEDYRLYFVVLRADTPIISNIEQKLYRFLRTLVEFLILISGRFVLSFKEMRLYMLRVVVEERVNQGLPGFAKNYPSSFGKVLWCSEKKYEMR